MFPHVSYSGLCGVGDTKEVARTPRLRSGGREESGHGRTATRTAN